jgi:murein DD-endopeptidase MepM/ murein hydrolase activator NlpD
LLAGSRFARAVYVMFAVAVLLALLKLGGFLGTRPFFLKMVPTTPVAKAAQPVAGDGEVLGDEALDLPDADALGTVGRLLTIGSKVSNLPGRQDSVRTRKPTRDEAPVFYRPSSGESEDGGPVCGNLGDFPKSSRVVFPLPEDHFDSYEDTWGAARPQGGHEGTDLMSPTGTPEFAITDGTIVPVKGANENGWNRLGGYTVMLEAASDAGPIEEGDLFYYAHME